MKEKMESNPSIQCSVCGQWKRLHGIKDGQAVQRYYPCCGENGEHEHEKDICDDCCRAGCPYSVKELKGMTESFYKSHTQDFFEGRFGIVLFDIKNRRGDTIRKGQKVKIRKRYGGIEATDINNHRCCINTISPNQIYLLP